MNVDDFLISKDISVREAMLRINSTHHRTLFVVNSRRLLQGSVTEGDILRFLMNGGVLSAKITQAMHTNPVRSNYLLDDASLIETSKRHGLILLPIVDKVNQVTDIQSLWEVL